MGNRHLSHWPQYVPQKLTLPETSLFYNLEVTASRFPDKPATIFYDGVLTYRELKAEVEAVAAHLQKCGVKRGDRVALNMQNSPQFVIAFYAILRADAMVMPVNPMTVTEELKYLLENSGAKVLLTSQELWAFAAPLVEQGVVEHAVVATYSEYVNHATDLSLPPDVLAARVRIEHARVRAWSDVIAEGGKPAPHLAGPDDLSIMPYTSGTTGNPKGCQHTHRSAMHTTILAAQWVRSYQDETVLTVLPLFHVTGMQNGMNGPIYSGATMVLLPRWDRSVAAALISRYKITGWTCVPTMVVDLLANPNLDQYDLSSMRGIGGGGAAMPEAVAAKLEELCGLKFVEGYGLSETMAATHVNPIQNPKKQCLGIPTCGVDSRVVNPDTLDELAPDEVGEIITYGTQVFQGYWNNPEANRDCFVEIEGKRFFRTGDMGYVDEDGYFFLVDRIKRMINAAGFKVWPAEVEAKLYKHPAVQAACIIAQKHPRRGETVKAIVVLKADAVGTTTEDEICEWSREHMAAYKIPRVVEFVSELPLGATKKVDWRQLQEREDARMAELS